MPVRMAAERKSGSCCKKGKSASSTAANEDAVQPLHVAALKGKTKLDAHEAEAHVPDFPKTQPSLFHDVRCFDFGKLAEINLRVQKTLSQSHREAKKKRRLNRRFSFSSQFQSEVRTKLAECHEEIEQVS